MLLEALGKNNYKNSVKVYIIESIPAILIVSLMLGKYSSIINFALTLLSLSPVVIAIPAVLVGILISNKRIMGKYAYTKTRLLAYFLTVAMIVAGGLVGILHL
nr:hypothetical protein [Saccharolobus solfataricus]